MLAVQMLVILMTLPCLTVDIGVRAYFRKLINSKCQNYFCARQRLDLNINFVCQKYYQPIKNSHNLL
jgi:hypothetical protein